MICIDCRYIRDRPSGIEPLVRALVVHLPALAPDLELLLLRHPRAPAPLSNAPNVSEVVVPFEPNSIGTMLGLPSAVDLRRVKLFHAPFNLLPYRLAVPTVVTVCDVMWLVHPEWARGADEGLLDVLFFRHGLRRALSRATRIAAISEATRAEIARVDPRAAARARVTLLGVSADFRPLEGSEGRARVESARARLAPGAIRHVLTVGQFAGYKNHPAVVRAFARAFGSDPGVHLVVIERLNRDAGERELRGLARALGVDARLHVHQTVAFDDLVALYGGALALCHPSLYEGFGNPPAEAMACGCPVVTSDRSSMPEVAGGAALLVDPQSDEAIAAALARIAGDPALAASLRARGMSRAAELSWESFARQNLTIYREVLALGPGRRRARS